MNTIKNLYATGCLQALRLYVLVSNRVSRPALVAVKTRRGAGILEYMILAVLALIIFVLVVNFLTGGDGIFQRLFQNIRNRFTGTGVS